MCHRALAARAALFGAVVACVACGGPDAPQSRAPSASELVIPPLVASAADAKVAPGVAQDDIRVGAFLSLSGSESTFGADTKDGIELAVEEANAAGGLKNRHLTVLYEDDKSIVKLAADAARRLTETEHVVALLGDVASSRSLAGGLVANTAHVPMLTPAATAPEVTKDREWVFRGCFDDDQQGRAMARFVKTALSKSSVAILHSAQDTYSSTLANAFRTELGRIGGKVAVLKSFARGETNFLTYLAEIKAAKPDLVFVPVYYNDMVVIARQAWQLGIPGRTFVGADGWDSAELLDGAAHELDGARFATHWVADAPVARNRAFTTAFRAKYKRSPSSMSALGYDSARLLFDAMSRATALSPEAIRVALAETHTFDGLTGALAMGEGGNPTKPVVIVEIKDRAFRYATTVASRGP